ncbi:myosin-9 [Anabrus simplex]|uniref:myosin-9 n=1 Tax=Anabrus simplex TaxID=316456 RepID=UPI0034DD1E29
MEPGGRLCKDLLELMRSFINFRELRADEEKSRQELCHSLRKLKEEFQFTQATERTERAKLNETRSLLHQQQETMNKLLVLKDENEKLRESTKDLKKTVVDLKTKVVNESAAWERRLRDMKWEHDKRVDEIRKKLQDEALKTRKHLELSLAELEVQQTESAKKLEELESTKTNEIHFTVQQYEKKVSNLEMALKEARAEKHQLAEHASANIAIYKRRVMELEHQVSQLNELGIQSPRPSRQPLLYHKPINPGGEQSFTDLKNPSASIQNSAPSVPYDVCLTASGTNREPLTVYFHNANKNKVAFPAVKKRKLFSNSDSGELL